MTLKQKRDETFLSQEAPQEHQELLELQKELQKLNRRYYQTEDTKLLLEDSVYDAKFRRLQALEEKYPKLVTETSPTQTIGTPPNKTFSVFKHPHPMLSLENAMDETELNDFFKKCRKNLGLPTDEFPRCCLSPKYDGLAIELVYINDRLVTASTRGDGTSGELVTHNIRVMAAVPKVLKSNEPVPSRLVRGEVVMHKRHFQTLNERLLERHKEALAQYNAAVEAYTVYEQAAAAAKPDKQSKQKHAVKPPKKPPPLPRLSLLSNPRNAAAGSIRQLKLDKERIGELEFYAYALFNGSSKDIETATFTAPASHYEGYETLSALGFNAHNEHLKTSQRCNSFTEVQNYYKHLSTSRHNLDYDIDGMVIELDKHKLRAHLGVVGRRPRYAVAWKFPPEVQTTKLEAVRFQVGRTGVITPVGIVSPVRLSGASVRHVTLHNKNEIARLELQIGDTVKITRSGDVIPKILSVVKAKRTGNEQNIDFPQTCPECNSTLSSTASDILIVCTNSFCPAQKVRAISHFVAKPAMNIEGISTKLIEELLRTRLISECYDLFTLSKTQLLTLDRMGDKLATNMLSAIAAAKRPTLARFIYALGIPNVGERTAELLAQTAQAVRTLLTLTRDQLAAIEDIGSLTADGIAGFLTNTRHRQLIDKLLENGVTPTFTSQTKGLPFSGKKFLFTGTLTSMPRQLAKEKVTALGGELSSTISKQLDYLVAGEKAGSKLKHAQKLNLTILSEPAFMELIDKQAK